MVIQTRIHDGIKIKTRTYRDIPYDRRGLSAFQSGFTAQKPFSRWGMMIILRGKARIVIAQFGKLPQPTYIPVTDQSTIYLGKMVQTIDCYDGEANDPEYVNHEYTINTIEWSKQ